MDVQVLAQALLDNMVEQLTAQDIALPSVQYLAPGAEVAFDCEQLTVSLTRIISNFGGADTPFPHPSALLMSSAEFFVTLVRCVPTFDDNGNPPPSSAMSDAAGVIMQDARALRRSLEKIDQAHKIVPRNVPVTIGELRTIGPSGGFAACSIMYTVMLVDNQWAPDQRPVAATRRL
jgi:hypothetical protein